MSSKDAKRNGMKHIGEWGYDEGYSGHFWAKPEDYEVAKKRYDELPEGHATIEDTKSLLKVAVFCDDKDE